MRPYPAYPTAAPAFHGRPYYPPARPMMPARPTTPARPMPARHPMPTRAPAQTASVHKVFVGGLATECSDEEFVEYFAQFGNLVDHIVMRDKATGKPRGFGFVQYDDPAAVDQ